MPSHLRNLNDHRRHRETLLYTMRFHIFISIVAALLFFTFSLSAQTPEPPAPNILVQHAAFIAVGTIQFNGVQCTFTATESVKGDNTAGNPITVLLPAAAGFAAWLQQAVAAAPTILVGTFDATTNQLTLTHSERSIWPQGTFPNYFADKTVAGCKDFIEKAHRD